MRFVAVVTLAALIGSATASAQNDRLTESLQLWDANRERAVPIALYFPAEQRQCAREKPCPVAFVSPGYGLRHTDYAFISEALAKSGYLVVAVQHDLPSDPPTAKTGDLFASRMPMWQRGVENLRFVRSALSRTHPSFDWSDLTLIGHSNGGDISALALRESPAFATTLVTLDNRRYPLPRSRSINILTIRGSDFPADPGVLPAVHGKGSNTCITTIAGSRHNDMNDHGPAELKSKIGRLLLQFLKDGRCET